jgi:protein ImuB
MSRPEELYACVYAREFPAQALLRLRPELHSQPCVVLEGEAPQQKVCSLNTKARLLGLARGMTMVEVESFPASVVLHRSFQTEALTNAVLLECAGAFSPRVEDRSCDTFFLCGIDIAGTRSLLGPPEMLARNLLQRVRVLGIAARITVSCNLHAAISVAQGMASGSSIKIIAPGDEANVLAPLSLHSHDLTAAQAETFSLWGIHTLGMLAALPENELISRMGQQGKRLRQLARGEGTHLFQPVEPAFTLEERIELDSPVELLDSLLFVLAVMLDQLILRATARIVALASVTVTLTLDGGSIHTQTVRPALATTDKLLWLKLLQLDLQAHPPPAPILALTLAAEPGSTSKMQFGLFSPQFPEAARLDITLARLRSLVGENCVGRAVLQDTHAPESFRIEPFTVSRGESVALVPAETRAAMRQLRPAETVSVTFENQRPITFFFRQLRYAVEHAYGPWRTSGEWWSGTLWGHEQWDVIARAQNGPLLSCCLMHDLMRNVWQMAALYD